MSNNRVLLTVSGIIPADIEALIASGDRPRVDYFEMASAFGADIADYKRSRAGLGRLGRLVKRIAGDSVMLAWHCFRCRHGYDIVVTDGEQVGLPLAAMMRLSRRIALPRHVMIVHVMSVPKKEMLYRCLRLGSRIDQMVLYSSAQRDFVVFRLGFPAEKTKLSSFMVDTRFFSPSPSAGGSRPPLICSAGLEFRDYPTLLAAIDGLDVRVVLAAASTWSKRSNELDGLKLPENVEVVRLDLHQLRDLYASSDVIVMPLREVDFQAGVTTLLEAMAMQKPIICSRTVGQTDVIDDGITGLYVEPGNVAELRAAILSLLDDSRRAQDLGTAARRWVESTADIDVYVERLTAWVAEQARASRT